MPKARNVNKMKTCSKCKKLKPNTEQYFSVASATYNGKKRYALRGRCRECRNEDQNEVRVQQSAYKKAQSVVYAEMKKEGIKI